MYAKTCAYLHRYMELLAGMAGKQEKKVRNP